jgi:hypothetical protein
MQPIVLRFTGCSVADLGCCIANPESEHFSIPDPDIFHPGSHKKEGCKISTLCFLLITISEASPNSQRDNSSRIRIPVPGANKAPDPGSAKLNVWVPESNRHSKTYGRYYMQENLSCFAHLSHRQLWNNK